MKTFGEKIKEARKAKKCTTQNVWPWNCKIFDDF